MVFWAPDGLLQYLGVLELIHLLIHPLIHPSNTRINISPVDVDDDAPTPTPTKKRSNHFLHLFWPPQATTCTGKVSDDDPNCNFENPNQRPGGAKAWKKVF